MRLVPTVATVSLVILAGMLPSRSAVARAPSLPVSQALPPPPPPAPSTARGAATEPTGTAIIRGRVFASDTGAPLRRAEVRISSAGIRDPRVGATDDQGYYEITSVPPGRHTLTVSRTGYVTMSYGQRRWRDPGIQLQVANGQTIERIDFILPRGAVIVARVTDDFGEPLAGQNVNVEQYRFTGGQRRLAPAGFGSAETNDLVGPQNSGRCAGESSSTQERHRRTFSPRTFRSAPFL